MAAKRTHGVKVGGVYTIWDRLGYWRVKSVDASPRRKAATTTVERVHLDGRPFSSSGSTIRVSCEIMTRVDAKVIVPRDARDDAPAHAFDIPDRLPEKLATAYIIAYGRWPRVHEMVRALGKKLMLPDGDEYPAPDVRRAFLDYAVDRFALSNGEPMDERYAIPVRPEVSFDRAEKIGERVVRSLLGMQASIDSKEVSVAASVVSDALTTVIARVESMTESTKRARKDAADAFVTYWRDGVEPANGEPVKE